MNRRHLERTRAVSIVVADAAESADGMYIHWNISQALKTGPTVRFSGVTHLQLAPPDRGGRIVRHRDYWDLLGALMRVNAKLEGAYRTTVRMLFG